MCGLAQQSRTSDQVCDELPPVETHLEVEKRYDEVAVRTDGVVDEAGDRAGCPVERDGVRVANLDREVVAHVTEGDTEVPLDRCAEHRQSSVVGIQAGCEEHVIVVREVLHHDRVRRLDAAVEAGQSEDVVREVLAVPAEQIVEMGVHDRTPALGNLAQQTGDLADAFGQHYVVAVAVRLDTRAACSVGERRSATADRGGNELRQVTRDVPHEVARALGAVDEPQVTSGEVQQHEVRRRNQVCGSVLVCRDVGLTRIVVDDGVGEHGSAPHFCWVQGDAHVALPLSVGWDLMVVVPLKRLQIARFLTT